MNEMFVDLSAALTGFARVDLLGTGVAAEYWNAAIEHAGAESMEQLLAAWQAVENSPESLETALRTEILSDSNLGPIARNIIKMWYLGQWDIDAEHSKVVSAEAYKQGLVWDAIGAHPQAAKQPGFGTWSLPPRNLTEEEES